MKQTCKAMLLAIGLTITTNGFGFIYEIDHYVNNSGQHIFLFSDDHQLVVNGVVKEEQPSKQQRNAIVKAAVENKAFVIVEDIFFMFKAGKRMFIDPKINEPEQTYHDLLTSPKTFNKNKDYSKYFSEAFFTETCPDWGGIIPLTYLSQLCYKKNVPVENIDPRNLLLSSLDGAPINGSDVYYEIDKDYETLAKFSKEDNPFAALIKNKLTTYDTIRKLSSELRNQIYKINKPIFATISNLKHYKELDDIFRLLLLDENKEKLEQLGIPENFYLQQVNTIINQVSDFEKILKIVYLDTAILIDMNILHSIYNHLNHKTVFVCAGGQHIYNSKKALEQLGYKKIDTFGSYSHYRDLMDPGSDVLPINIATYFAKDGILEKEKKETPVQDVCAVCRKPGAKFRCGNCKHVNYCSQDCQRKDWPNHKKVCKKK